jgi:hypothetical protein
LKYEEEIEKVTEAGAESGREERRNSAESEGKK